MSWLPPSESRASLIVRGLLTGRKLQYNKVHLGDSLLGTKILWLKKFRWRKNFVPKKLKIKLFTKAKLSLLLFSLSNFPAILESVKGLGLANTGQENWRLDSRIRGNVAGATFLDTHCKSFTHTLILRLPLSYLVPKLCTILCQNCANIVQKLCKYFTNIV